MFRFILITLLLFFSPLSSVYANNPPNLLDPANNSSVTDTSPKLSWENPSYSLYTTKPFRIQVDNNSDFSSTEKDYSTDNTYYSPSLNSGTWYWKVKAKDSSGTWSDWNSSWQFAIAEISASQTPSSTPNQTITPSAQPPPTTSQKSENVFSIKDTPSEINSDQEFEISVSLKLENNSNQSFFLKGAFKSPDSSNYFGQTKSGNDWIGNSQKYSSQLKISTNSEGKWEGKIKTRPDGEDSGFNGTGNYILKVGRYSESGSGPSWSNELTVKINAAAKPETSESKAEANEVAAEDPEEIDLSESIVKEPPRFFEIKIASVAGVSAKSDNTESSSDTKVMDERNTNWLLVILGILILLSGAGFVYYKFKKEKMSAKSFN